MSKSQLRAIEAVGLMIGGVLITVVGVELLFRVPEKVAGLALFLLPMGRAAKAGAAVDKGAAEAAGGAASPAAAAQVA